MTTGNVYDNGMGALAQEKGFFSSRRKGVRVTSGRVLNFLDIKATATGTESAQYEAKARSEFPYPPLNCEDAVSSSLALDAKLTALNETIAAGVDIKNNQKRIAVLQKVKSDFDTYVNKANCIKQALQEDDQAYNQSWQDLLNKEQGDQSGKGSADTWIVFGALGLLLVGAMYVIFKKKNPA